MGEFTYPFPNFNGETVEVWEWISNSTPHFITDVITYPSWDYNQSMLVKGFFDDWSPWPKPLRTHWNVFGLLTPLVLRPGDSRRAAKWPLMPWSMCCQGISSHGIDSFGCPAEQVHVFNEQESQALAMLRSEYSGGTRSLQWCHMSAMTAHITGNSTVCPTSCSGLIQRNYQTHLRLVDLQGPWISTRKACAGDGVNTTDTDNPSPYLVRVPFTYKVLVVEV